MLLVDSLYINSSGGLLLLKYLTRELSNRKVSFYLLADQRCKGIFDSYPVEYLKASHNSRKHFYQKHEHDFTSVLCFGNIPPLIKLSVPVYTYFHNINLLTLNGLPSLQITLFAFIKREYIKHYKKNTDKWIVQTSNTRNELQKHLKEEYKKQTILPFYEIPNSIIELSCHGHREDYAYVAYYSGSKGHDVLLHAWEILHEKGFDKCLHLTVNESHPSFLKKISEAQKKGVNIINHGQIPFSKVSEIYQVSKAVVYPSLNESLGLGVVEAISAGCDIIGSDLPFIHSICSPSITFDPSSPISLADAILKYEKDDLPKSKLLISNSIEQLIDLIIA